MRLSEAEIEKLRQSGVRLDADGRFWHENAQVTHHGMVAAFWRWLDRNPDGRYVLRLDAQRFVYLDVDDTPFIVRSMRWDEGRALLRLSDDSEVELDPRTLRLRPDGVVVCTVKGRFEARFSTAAWSTLADHIIDHDGTPTLDTASGRVALR